MKAGAPSQIARYAGQVRKKSGEKGSGRVSDLVRRFEFWAEAWEDGLPVAIRRKP